MINKLKNYWEVFVIFLFSLTPLIWLKGDEIVIGHDSGFRLNYLDHLRNLFYSWNPIGNFGYDWGILKGFLIIQAPETFFSWLFNSLTVGEKISFVLWFFVIGISMYVFINYFFSKKEFWIFRIFSSVFYIYNFFLLQAWFIAERAKFSLIAALPLGLLVIYKTLTKEYSILKGTILFSFIFFFLNGGGSPPLYGSLILVYLITFVYLTLINVIKNGAKEIIYSFKLCISFLLGFAAINAYFLLPQAYEILNKYSAVLSSIGGIQGVLAWENAINKFASFLNLLRLQGIPDWYDNLSHPYSEFFVNNLILIAMSFLPILVITIGLFFHRKFNFTKQQKILFYLVFLIFLIGIIFTSGSHPPLGPFYIFLVEHLPGFAIFRSALYKFGPTLWFSVIFLTGLYINFLALRYFRTGFWFKVVGILFIAFIPLYHFPFFTIDFFEFNKPFTTKVNVPDYVKSSISYLKGLPSGTRILLLPSLDPIYKVDSYNWGFWSLESLPKLSLNHSVVASDNVSPQIVNNIYNSLDRNDTELFLRLLGITGTNKILWRDDVLYNDKKTTSQDLNRDKNNIENIENISLERSFDKWSIYNIESDKYLPTFYSSKSLDYSISGLEYLPDLLSQKLDPRSSIVIAEILPDKNLKKLLNKIYIAPKCILCKDKEFEEYKKNIILPQVRILPSSKFYFLKYWRDVLLVEKYKNFPVQKIDLDLSFSNKIMGEIFGVVFEDKLDSRVRNQHAKNLVEKYKNTMNNVLNDVEKVSEMEKNNSLIRTLAFLQRHKIFLSKLHFRPGFSNELYQSMALFIDQKISYVEKKVWMSTSLETKRLLFGLPEKGTYSIEFLSKDSIPIKVFIDDREIKKINEMELMPGDHRLELIYNSIPNLLGEENNEELFFENNEKRKFMIQEVSPGERYSLTFEYKIIEGDNSLFEILSQDKGGLNEKFKLRREPEWQTFYYEFSTANDSIEFNLENISQEKNITVLQNINFTKVFLPKVFISQKVGDTNLTQPNIEFRKINPTEYVVSINNAQGPYLLNFGESFDKGWKAYLFDESKKPSIIETFFKKPLGEENHLKINGYSNSWLIEKKGDYNLLVLFYPQKVFYVGLVLSSATLAFFIYTLLKLKKI